jgi:uncharacterized protein (DUF1330 family)
MRGPIVEVVEGRLDAKEDTRLVLIEFASLEAAREWYESDEYKELIGLREEPAASTTAFFVDGVDLESRGGGQ